MPLENKIRIMSKNTKISTKRSYSSRQQAKLPELGISSVTSLDQQKNHISEAVVLKSECKIALSNQLPPFERETGETSDEELTYKKQCKINIYNQKPSESHLLKYWYQRHRLFSRFDDGIKLDEESWFSVTPEKIAKHIAKKCCCDVIIDAFCGAGGNAIQFAFTCKHVIAIDHDSEKIALAKNNAKVYGVHNHIDFVCADFLNVIPTLKANAIFLSPPWGGPKYLRKKSYNLANMKPDIYRLFKMCCKVTPNVILFAPRNASKEQLILLAGKGNSVEIEENMLNHKIKTITAYYGNLVQKNT